MSRCMAVIRDLTSPLILESALCGFRPTLSLPRLEWLEVLALSSHQGQHCCPKGVSLDEQKRIPSALMAIEQGHTCHSTKNFIP